MQHKLIDLTNDVREFENTFVEATKRLSERVREEIKPFVYDKTRTEWDYEASKQLLSVLTFIGHSRKEISEIGGEDLPSSRLTQFANAKEERGLIDIQVAKAFIDVVDMLVEDYEKNLHSNEDEEQEEHHEHHEHNEHAH